MISNYLTLAGKKALVTGCSSGIGESMAIGLAEAGADIIGVSSSLQSGSKVEKRSKKSGRNLHSKFLISVIGIRFMREL